MNEATNSATISSNAFRWWTALRRDPGARARLRRCRSALDAASNIDALDLVRRIGATRCDVDFLRACELARVLAWVKEDHADPLIRRVGWSNFPSDNAESTERPPLSEARFRRLLRVDDASEFADALIRLLRLAEQTASVAKLASDFWSWCDEPSVGDTKRRWAYAYYAAASAAPTLDPHEAIA